MEEDEGLRWYEGKRNAWRKGRKENEDVEGRAMLWAATVPK